MRLLSRSIPKTANCISRPSIISKIANRIPVLNFLHFAPPCTPYTLVSLFDLLRGGDRTNDNRDELRDLFAASSPAAVASLTAALLAAASLIAISLPAFPALSSSIRQSSSPSALYCCCFDALIISLMALPVRVRIYIRFGLYRGQ